MLAELLTNYGPIARLWWDDYGLGRAPPGGPPAPGDRGGFPEAFTDFTKLVRSLQSQTVILPGPDGCLVGRELGFGTYPVFNFNQLNEENDVAVFHRIGIEDRNIVNVLGSMIIIIFAFIFG